LTSQPFDFHLRVSGFGFLLDSTGPFADKCRVRICVIFNPTAKGDKARHFRQRLDRIAREAALKLTQQPNHASDLAAEAVREGFEVIVAAGGDGTVNEVLNGLAQEPRGCERARLAVLPLGTMNVFARELGIPLNLDAAWETIRRGRETRIDLARAEFGGEGGRQVRYFCQMGGAGLDARAIELVDWGTKKKVGPVAYVLAGLRAVAETPPKITVTAGTEQATGELVLLGNGRLYGGPFRIFPGANPRDGLLEICLFPKARWTTVLWCGSRLLTLLTLPPGAVRRLRAQTLTLTAASPVPFELDGEWAGRLPATFHVEPEALRVIVP
jgi:YegS/Rv2252/BmrU family lipid kinase